MVSKKLTLFKMLKRSATYVQDQCELFLLTPVLQTIPIFKNAEWWKEMCFPNSSPPCLLLSHLWSSTQRKLQEGRAQETPRGCSAARRWSSSFESGDSQAHPTSGFSLHTHIWARNSVRVWTFLNKSHTGSSPISNPRFSRNIPILNIILYQF